MVRKQTFNGPLREKLRYDVGHKLSQSDQDFRSQIESCTFPLDKFDHTAHVRLAYIYLLVGESPEQATNLMRTALKRLLTHANIDPSAKYHETLTKAWIYAVQHFMNISPNSQSAADFIANNAQVSNSKIMQSHYSADLLFSEEARASFVEPDKAAIPRY